METKNWWQDENRAPKLIPGDTLLFSEHGRILGNIDYRSHWFRLVRGEYGDICLLVEHGAGHERIQEFTLRRTVDALAVLDSDARYLMLYALKAMYREGATRAVKETANKYQTAFVEGRLKKRKIRGQEAYRVTLEPKQQAILG